MVASWTDETTLDAYEALINEFTESLLRDYISYLQNLAPANRPAKEFNDPVWGTVSLSAFEILILDSPLLQRLRRVRQLGVAHYVYTSANHTRIDHSVGVCHQIGVVAQAVVKHAAELDRSHEVARFQSLIPTLRVAGLCHDVGHGLMSHVSENALAMNRRVTRLTLAYQERFGKSAVQLSEMAAYYMILSPAFKELIKAALDACRLANDPGMPETMANLVAGLTVVNHLPLLHELVSGPFDADKMDYMKRDALMCGVPIVTDIERLVQKIRGVEKVREDLPEEIKPRVTTDDDRFLLLGVARSGARALDELALGRSLMFDKVYRHHKVRAVEAMVANIVAAAGPAMSITPEMLPLTVHDDMFIDITSASLEKSATSIGVDPSSLGIAEAAALANCLRQRDLFVRVLAFASKSPFDEVADAENRRLRNRQFVSKLRTAAGKTEFIAAVAQETATIAQLVGRESQLAVLPGNLTSYIAVDPPTNDPGNQDSAESYAYLIDESGSVIPIAKSNADIRGWVDAYINTRDIGYVFSPRAIADIVHVAAELVMKRDHSVRMPHQLGSWSKSDHDAVSSLKKRISEAGYYQGTLRALGPTPEVLRQGNFPDRIDAIRQRFQGYQGPAVATSDRTEGEIASFDKRAVLDWVKQFAPEFAPLAIQLVERVMMIARPSVVEAVKKFMSATGITAATIAPLGDQKDGSSIVAYYAGDLQDSLGVKIASVSEALTLPDPIVIIDDFLGIGNSATSILEKLLGEEPTTSLKEERYNELSDEAKALFRGRELNFVFVAALDEGIANLQRRAKELGITITIWSLLKEHEIPSLADLEAEPKYGDFVDELARIGAQIHADTEDFEKKQPELGYGNKGKLLITTFNTPTVTLSALWKAGQVDGEDWTPLFPRRKKK